MSLPAQEWKDSLEGFEGVLPDESNALLDDIKDIVVLAADPDFSLVVGGMRQASQMDRVQNNLMKVLHGLVIEIQSIDIDLAEGKNTDTLEAMENVVYGLASVVEQIIPGLRDFIDLGLMVFLITNIIEFLTVLPQGPIAIAQWIVEEVIVYMNQFVINLMSLNMFPNTDAECMEELMLCDYTQMMLSVVPEVIGQLPLSLSPVNSMEQLVKGP
jgi:hypothetical protein